MKLWRAVWPYALAGAAVLFLARLLILLGVGR